jgi:hypothetical protein
MGSFSLSGGVEVFGFISPSNTTDQYPVIDPLYGIDGLRNVNSLSDLNTISPLRRRAGMVVGVSGGTAYYKLNLPPWNNTLSDWSIFNSGGGSSGDYLPLSGGTVTGNTIFTNGVTANTFSASTYFNLPTDVFVTGGTYSGNTITFTNNSGGTFNVTGITSSTTFTGGTVSGATNFTNGLSANTISATTYVNLPTDIRVTGGTYSNGTATFTNNTGGTFNVLGFFTGSTDVFVTGATYSNNTFTYRNNTGGTFNVNFNTLTGVTVNGDLSVTGNTLLNGLTANTISATTYQNLPLDVFVTGGTFSGGVITFINNSGGTFGVSGISSFDTFVTGLTYQDNTLTILQNSGSPISVLIDTFTGLTINGDLNVTGTTYSEVISATTYQNLPIDPDTYVTGFSYSDNTFTIYQNSGSSLNATIDSVTGLTVNGTLNSTTFSGGTYFGDGSNLNGIIRGSGGGRLFYFNLSNTQSPYYEFSPSATTLIQQSITTSAITSGSTSTIAGFLTPPNVPDVFLLPGGIWSFYLHSYAEDISSSFEIFCEVYQRTTGGTEIFLFQTDPAPITSYSPNPSMSISDSYYSGASLDFSDRLLVKVNVTNLGTTSKTVTFVTEDGIHYSYSTTSLIIPVVDTFTTGFTYGDNTLTIQRNEGLSDLSVTINSVTGLTINGNLSVTGTTSSETISATTYQNLPTDVRVTGGTYSNGTTTFTNNTGGTFNVTGFFTGNTDVFVTGATYSNNTFTYTNNTGGTFNVNFNTLTGLTINGDLSVTGTTSSGTISATTYQNLPTDIRVTGGTYSNGTTTFTNNTGGTFNVTGFFTGYTNVVNSVTTGVGLSGNTTTGNITLINTSPDQIVTISGGTGITTGGTYPNFTITNSAPNQIVTISGGTGITTGGTYPNFTITNSLPDQVVTLSGGTNISVSGTYPNFNIQVTGSTTSTFEYGKTYAIANSFQLI